MKFVKLFFIKVLSYRRLIEDYWTSFFCFFACLSLFCCGGGGGYHLTHFNRILDLCCLFLYRPRNKPIFISLVSLLGSTGICSATIDARSSYFASLEQEEHTFTQTCRHTFNSMELNNALLAPNGLFHVLRQAYWASHFDRKLGRSVPKIMKYGYILFHNLLFSVPCLWFLPIWSSSFMRFWGWHNM